MKKFRKNNKGFSLVELIIVIAIMVALIAILAPQYLKFVEKSRLAADKTQMDEIVNAVKIYAADPDTEDLVDTISFTVEDGVITIPATPAEIQVALGKEKVELKSEDGKACGDFNITIDEDTYAVECSVDYEAWGEVAGG